MNKNVCCFKHDILFIDKHCTFSLFEFCCLRIEKTWDLEPIFDPTFPTAGKHIQWKLNHFDTIIAKYCNCLNENEF